MEETARDFLEKVPATMNLQEVIHKPPLLYEESMNTVLVPEVIRYNPYGIMSWVSNWLVPCGAAEMFRPLLPTPFEEPHC